MKAGIFHEVGDSPDGNVREPWRSMFKVAAATAVFGVIHSLMASRSAKRAAARTFGVRNRNGLYRVGYICQSLVTVGILAAYSRRQPSGELYRIRGSPRTTLFVTILFGVVFVSAVHSTT